MKKGLSARSSRSTAPWEDCLRRRARTSCCRWGTCDERSDVGERLPGLGQLERADEGECRHLTFFERKGSAFLLLYLILAIRAGDIRHRAWVYWNPVWSGQRRDRFYSVDGQGMIVSARRDFLPRNNAGIKDVSVAFTCRQESASAKRGQRPT